MIKGIIFDLDMCILDTRTLEGPFFDPVLNALRSSALPEEHKQEIEKALLTTSLEDAVEVYAIPDDVAEAIRQAYRTIEAPDRMSTFGDEECLRELSVTRVLVTTGYTRYQSAKIDKLGIRDLFDEIRIDSTDDPSARIGKKKIFIQLMEKYGWLPEEVLVVGDNPVSELAAAKALGILAIQTVRPSIEPWSEADGQITSLRELAKFI